MFNGTKSSNPAGAAARENAQSARDAAAALAGVECGPGHTVAATPVSLLAEGPNTWVMAGGAHPLVGA